MENRTYPGLKPARRFAAVVLNLTKVFSLVFVLASHAAAQTLTSITVTPTNPTIAVGQTQPFTAMGMYSDGSTVTLSSGGEAIAILAGGFHTCALLSEATVSCWGSDGSGQLGNGTTGTISSMPVMVSGITNATAIAAGGFHTCTLLSDATMKCWGDNYDGQLGNGTAYNFSSTPVAVYGISNATGIAGGAYHTCALLSDTTVEC